MRDRKGQDCPSALELFEYINSTLPETQTTGMRKHIETCEICIEALGNLKGYMAQDRDRSKYQDYKVPEYISKLGKQRTLKAGEAMNQVRSHELSFGQLWSTKTLKQDDQENELIMSRIVAILSEDCLDNSSSATVIVAPISLELEFQSKYDLRVFEEESPLGYGFMIEIWNQTTTLVSQLDSYLGSLSEKLIERLKLLDRAYLGLDGDLSSLSDRIGWPIIHESDPRALFQAQEVEECRYLHESALLEVAGAESPSGAIFKEIADIWFRKGGENSLYFADVKEKEPELLAVAAPNDTIKNWFLYARGKLGSEEIIGKFSLNLVRDELRLIFERLPEAFVYNEMFLIGYGKSRTELFSETLKAELGKRFVIAKNKRVRPRDIEEINIKVSASS